MYHYVTNNHHRDILDGWDLTPSERAEFDYIDWQAVEGGSDSASFVRYRGDLIDLGDVPRAEGQLAADGWDGALAESAWDGLAFRYVRDGERFTCADHNDTCIVIARVTW